MTPTGRDHHFPDWRAYMLHGWEIYGLIANTHSYDTNGTKVCPIGQHTPPHTLANADGHHHCAAVAVRDSGFAVGVSKVSDALGFSVGDAADVADATDGANAAEEAHHPCYTA